MSVRSRGRHVSAVCHRQSGDLGAGCQTGAVEFHLVDAGAQVTKVKGFVSAGGHLGLAHGQEPFAQHFQPDAAFGVFI